VGKSLGAIFRFNHCQTRHYLKNKQESQRLKRQALWEVAQQDTKNIIIKNELNNYTAFLLECANMETAKFKPI
jgi:hypothetical protein